MFEYFLIASVVTLFFLYRAGRIEKRYITEVKKYGVEEDVAKIALTVMPLTYGLLWPIFVPLWLITKIFAIMNKS